jgi:hypothetical protein
VGPNETATVGPNQVAKSTVPFAETRLCAVFSDGHAAASKEHVTLEDFANDEWILLPRNVNATIHETILETAARTGIPFRQAHGVINAEQAFLRKYVRKPGSGRQMELPLSA